ncbi:Bardet-Biedl syndrome 2 protein-like [Armadillidium vulgare]|nr:Bardet-Biedl syndrome 2 protein-like [Armadillidium vulgare]
MKELPVIVMWINASFLLLEDVSTGEDGGIDKAFLSLRTSMPIVIRASPQGHVAIHSHDMDLAADIVQAMATYLNIEDLQVEADFPKEFEELTTILERVQEYQNTRQRLTADMADNSGLIKAFVVRAEDARIIGDMQSMKKWYGELYAVNQDMISNYKIRVNNHHELLSCLKQVNQTIQKAGRLRVGKSKTLVVNACRQAIKNNNLGALTKIMKTGYA